MSAEALGERVERPRVDTLGATQQNATTLFAVEREARCSELSGDPAQEAALAQQKRDARQVPRKLHTELHSHLCCELGKFETLLFFKKSGVCIISRSTIRVK